MNSLMCRLTGGHKYDDRKREIGQIPDDIRNVWVYNRCVKCGRISIAIMGIDSVVQTKKE